MSYYDDWVDPNGDFRRYRFFSHPRRMHKKKKYECDAEGVLLYVRRRANSDADPHITMETIKRVFGTKGLKAFEEAEKKGWVIRHEDPACNTFWYVITEKGTKQPMRDTERQN